jgi:hypothetical protein
MARARGHAIHLREAAGARATRHGRLQPSARLGGRAWKCWLAGGNAVDAAVAMQFALTVVEPMMVGLIGGTTCHIRLADGSHRILDGMSAVPQMGHPDMYSAGPRRRARGL